MRCQEKDCWKCEISGRCNTCKKNNYLCVDHLSKHMKMNHKIVQLDQEEIDDWIQINEHEGKSFNDSKLLNEINKIKDKIISCSNEMIEAIKKSVKKALDFIQKQTLIYLKLRIEDINETKFPRINIEKIERIIKLSRSIFPVNDRCDYSEEEVKLHKLVTDYESLIEVKNKEVIYLNDQDSVRVTIWKAEVVKTGKIIAIKECSSLYLDRLRDYFKEANILRKLSGISKNFLKFYADKLNEIIVRHRKLYVYTIQMEFVETTLKNDKLTRDDENRPYNNYEILSIYRQLINAYNLMREKNILHCDIKPSNIMITNRFVIKIIDFNIAKFGIDERTQYTRALGTKYFMSPELRLGFDQGYHAELKEDKSDVYSLGLTILYLITQRNLVDVNLKQNRHLLIEIVDSIQYEWLKPILHGMLKFDCRERYGFNNLFKEFSYDDETKTAIV